MVELSLVVVEKGEGKGVIESKYLGAGSDRSR